MTLGEVPGTFYYGVSHAPAGEMLSLELVGKTEISNRYTVNFGGKRVELLWAKNRHTKNLIAYRHWLEDLSAAVSAGIEEGKSLEQSQWSITLENTKIGLVLRSAGAYNVKLPR